MLSEGILKIGVSQLAMTHFACPYDAHRISIDARHMSIDARRLANMDNNVWKPEVRISQWQNA